MSLRLRRLWIQLTADRKRFATLCVAVSLAMLLWARLIVVSRMPRVAVASEQQSAVSDQQSAAESQLLNPDRHTAPPIQVTLFQETARDPFVISPRFFPRPGVLSDLPPAPGKSSQKLAEEPHEQEARVTAVLQSAVGRLRLEAAVAGSMAVINGRTFRIGEVIEVNTTSADQSVQFILADVKQRAAVLECLGRQFEIRMQGPR
jgi:hypothetical protein